MISLAIFLLFFCSPSKAYVIMDSIYKNIIPEYLWPINQADGGERIFFKYISYYCGLLVSELKVENSFIPRIKRFLELEGVSLFQSIFITYFNFECNFLIFSQMMSAGTDEKF